MITFPMIWWLFPAAVLAFIAFSFLLTRSGKLENATVRNTLVGAGAMLGFLTLALPLFEQPTFYSPLAQYGLGLPLLILGLFGRGYPAVYLRRKGTTTTLDEVGKLVDSGPYAWVRHPQYTAGLVMLLGWFLAWGAWYALGFMPIIAGMIYAQALIEEKYILEKVFGEAYAAYRERVGMLLPHLGGNDPLRITTAFLGSYAGLSAIQHGIFEILQGSRVPDGLMFNAIGPPCQPEAAWHACFPALTLIPNLLVTGIAAILVGLGMAVWAAAFVGRKRGGLVLGALSLLALLVGGGFVPVFIGMVAFHTHRCPYLAIGFRMGNLAMADLRFDRQHNRGLLVLPEFGDGNPYSCIMDGVRAATGAIYGQILIAKTFYGKLAVTFYFPRRGSTVRYSLQTGFVDQLERSRFHAYRLRGIDPADMPPQIIEEVLTWLEAQAGADLFEAVHEVGFPYHQEGLTFAKTRCVRCGEYVLDTFVRVQDGQSLCIPCSCEA